MKITIPELALVVLIGPSGSVNRALRGSIFNGRKFSPLIIAGDL